MPSVVAPEIVITTNFDVTIDVKVGIMTIFVIIGIYVSEFCRTFIQYSKKVLQTSDWDAGQLLVLSLISQENQDHHRR